MSSVISEKALRAEYEARVEPDDGVTRCRQACEDLLAEMGYVLDQHCPVNEEQDWPATGEWWCV